MTEELLFAILFAQQESNKLLEKIHHDLHQPHHHHHHHYSIRIEANMASIQQGGKGTITAALLDNGTPVTGFTPSFQYAADDTNVTLTPSTDTTSVVVEVPTSDTATTFNLLAKCQAPDGSTVTSDPFPITISPASTPQKFTIQLTQTA